MIEKRIRGDEGRELDVLFYPREHTQMVRLTFSGSSEHAVNSVTLSLEAFWRQMTQIMDEAAGLGVPNAIGVYNCENCKAEFKFANATGEPPAFCPGCGTGELKGTIEG